MKKNIKKKWLKALRSDKYVQGRNVLHCGENVFCCLGVLCELHRKENKGQWDGEYYYNEKFVLPKEVRIWAGLENDNPSVEGYGLAHYNDEVQASFKYIANLIETDL